MIAVLALLVIIWIVVQRTNQLPDAVTDGPTAPTVFETSMQKGYPDIVEAMLTAGAYFGVYVYAVSAWRTRGLLRPS